MVKHLILGNGVAGTTAAEAIRKQDPDAGISIISDEDLPFYYRIRLPEYLAGAVEEKSLLAKQENWYREHHISLHLETRITDADPEKKRLPVMRANHIPMTGCLSPPVLTPMFHP